MVFNLIYRIPISGVSLLRRGHSSMDCSLNFRVRLVGRRGLATVICSP